MKKITNYRDLILRIKQIRTDTKCLLAVACEQVAVEQGYSSWQVMKKDAPRDLFHD